MTVTEHAQSLAEFRANTSETIDRLNQTGEPEILTIDGEPRAILLSPAAYHEMAQEISLSRYAENMRRALQEIKDGKSVDAEVFFADLHNQLLAMKTAQLKGNLE